MEGNRVGADAARRSFRELLNAVEHHGEHVTVLRYETPAAVIVPVSWYEQARRELGKENAG